MRPLAIVLVALAVIAVGGAAEAKEPRRPASLKEIARRLDSLKKRIGALIEAASKDPDEAKIKAYKGYSDKELKKTRGRVRADDLVGFMLDGDKNFTLRKDAMEAVHGGIVGRYDPDLSLGEKHGTRSRRAAFCKTHLLKHLRDDQRLNRALTFDLLKRLWSVDPARNPVIMAYQVDREDTWKPAVRAWDKLLKKN